VLVITQLQRWSREKAKEISPKTRENNRRQITKYIAPTLGHLRLQKLKPGDIHRFYSALAAQYGDSLLRQVRTILVQAFDAAVLDEVLLRNPAKGIRLPRGQESGETSRALDPDEVRAFLNAADSHPLSVLPELLILTGLRRSEACGLRWDHLDLEQGLLSVQERVAMVEGRPMLGPLKTRASLRTVPLAPSTVALLQRWRAEQTRRHAALKISTENNRVFTNINGGPLHPDALSRLVSNLGRDAHLGRVRCHDLRHTFASLHLARGVPAEVVQVWLGHASVTVTLDVYRHILPHEHGRHVAGLEQLLDQGPANVSFANNDRFQQPPKAL
jgi:integrase